MFATYSLVITYRKNTPEKLIRKLCRNGVDRFGENKLIGNVSLRQYDRITGICEKNGLNFWLDNNFRNRGNKYRGVFFRNHRPVIFGMYYCAYCGKLLRKNDVTVDHLYSISAVGRDARMQRKMRRKGYRNVNDQRNLVASCERCNLKKGEHQGFWVIRGSFGRMNLYWTFRHLFNFSLLIFVLIFVYAYLCRFYDLPGGDYLRGCFFDYISNSFFFLCSNLSGLCSIVVPAVSKTLLAMVYTIAEYISV